MILRRKNKKKGDQTQSPGVYRPGDCACQGGSAGQKNNRLNCFLTLPIMLFVKNIHIVLPAITYNDTLYIGKKF